jgi:hypothetical protein
VLVPGVLVIGGAVVSFADDVGRAASPLVDESFVAIESVPLAVADVGDGFGSFASWFCGELSEACAAGLAALVASLAGTDPGAPHAASA